MSDPLRLERFVQAQHEMYETALAELRAGRKRSHWMWFIFPQYAGLGSSPTSEHFAIGSRAEAEAYLAHPVLGARLRECARVVLDAGAPSAADIFGPVDAMKLRSSATLFAVISPPRSVFHQVVEKYFHGEADARTLSLMREPPEC